MLFSVFFGHQLSQATAALKTIFIYFDLPPPYTHALQAAAGITHTVQSLITDFLQGSGLPCPALFAEVCDSFSPLVSLDTVGSPAFWP